MRQLVRTIILFGIGTFAVAACSTDARDPGEAEANAGATTTAPPATERVLTVTGGGPVIQVLPGPAQFADSARPVIDRMPQAARDMMLMMAKNGPFSDKVAVVSGTMRATYWDRGAQGDSVAGTAEFKTQDGASWRVVLKGVAPEDANPMEPHFGGVATNIGYHGSTGMHVPLVPTVQSAVSLWGMADVYRDGKLVAQDAPVHTMLTSDTRGDDFAYKCWDCTREPIEQFHLMLMPPEGKPYQVPGGVLHVMWEKSTFTEAS
ncbi:MAG: hypothetical protein NUW01_11135 [Gemmatimonadaceae bacterium]|nr:hypothetical protein [Gemmatimonadaceae bacterium]